MSDFHKKKAEKKKQIGYYYTNEQIRAIEAAAVKQGVVEGFNILLGLVCLVLHNSFGFGKGRCTTVCDRMLYMFKQMDVGGYTLQEIAKAASELGGVKTIL